MAAELTVIRWRDIPAQVTVARRGSAPARAQLSDRFQEAIDEAALAGRPVRHRRVPRRVAARLAAVRRRSGGRGAAEAERLEAAYDDERLRALARAGGVDEERPA